MKSFEKLKTKLAELFQLDQANLDFGIYRIMNARREEIIRFLDQDLLPQVQEAFKQYQSADKVELQKKLEKVIEGIKAADMDPDESPKVKALRNQINKEAVDITALENEVYDHLYSFFSRYYDEGDFISLRRYKEGVYAIPYEGEEVKLHWANHDQYYVKTTEHFRDYAFKTPSGHRVHFKITEADTEKDNIKAANGNDRRFLLCGDNSVAEENGELVIRFEFRPDDEKRKQDQINAQTANRVFEDLNTEELAVWQHRLSIIWQRSDGKETDKTILDKHLYDYTRRNTFDYFIHKDLFGFLRRELDFYIKSEVMRLDDVEEESAPRVEQYLSKIKVIRRIAHKIIDFLSQIEDFQKKLWLKKKFVIQTNYCVTLDRVPEELYPEIAANEAQREEWVRLFAINEIEGDKNIPVYTEPLTLEFLRANPFLVLDTRHFNIDFKFKLISSFDNIYENCHGIIICSENFQAINLITPTYENSINAIYIDPPYNTDASSILYKNDYKNSSWLAMISDRCLLARKLLKKEGVISVAIDDVEFPYLELLMHEIYGHSNILGIASIRSNPAGRSTPTGFSVAHDYTIFVGRSGYASIGRIKRNEKQLARYKERDGIGAFEWVNFRKHGGTDASRAARPRMFYPLFAYEGKIRIPQVKWLPNQQKWDLIETPKDNEEIIWPINPMGEEKRWKWGIERVEKNTNDFCAKIEQGGGTGIYMKSRIKKEGMLPVTWWDRKEYSATEYGTNYLSRIIGNSVTFSFPKSIFLVQDCIRVSCQNNKAIIFDFFAGSGTTGHAVINLNKEDDGYRKYILVEMGDYFDVVLKCRLIKAIYSNNWQNGKPVSRDGISHIFKYIHLESYEDALANIGLQRTKKQQSLLDQADDFKESYMLKYILDIESKGSQSLLNIEKFDDPWNYKILVGTGSVGETKPVNVDLVETFNWLLGLKVRHIDKISDFQVVEGENPEGEKVLVIWRKIRDLNETEPEKITAAREKANRDLDEFFRKQQYNTLDSEFDVIYVNGDNNLMNLPLNPEREGVEPRYKMRLIEEAFSQLMFDVKDV